MDFQRTTRKEDAAVIAQKALDSGLANHWQRAAIKECSKIAPHSQRHQRFLLEYWQSIAIKKCSVVAPNSQV